MSDKRITKERANEIYDDLQKAMGHMLAKNRNKNTADTGRTVKTQAATKEGLRAAGAVAYGRSKARQGALGSTPQRSKKLPFALGMKGQQLALLMVGLSCCAKVTLSALEVSGVGKVEEAQAVIVRPPTGPQWSKEEAKLLTALDSRRVEMEERSTRLEQRETEFAAKERELAVRLTELKELTEKLKLERVKGDKQKSAQLDQLANVYGSMNPPEAAHLLEQLDIQVSLALIERMPEKRMGQILALMNPQRALELTNLLSQRKS